MIPNQRNTLKEIIADFEYLSGNGLGRTHVLEHFIDTESAEPIFQRGYPVSPTIQERMKTEIQCMLCLDVEAYSHWSSPVVLVKKKNGKDRLCVDSRKLNEVTKRSRFLCASYALPRIDSIL